MALTVEDGTGITAADSYVSEAEYTTFLAATGKTLVVTTYTAEQQLRLGGRFIDTDYFFEGEKTAYTNGMEFPRTGLENASSQALPSTSVPQRVKDAQMEASYRFGANTDLAPDRASPGAIKKKKSGVGSLQTEIEYFGGNNQQPSIPVVDNLLKDFTLPPGEMVRA